MDYTWKSHKPPTEVANYLLEQNRSKWSINIAPQEQYLLFKIQYKSHGLDGPFYQYPILSGYIAPAESGSIICADEIFDKFNCFDICLLLFTPIIVTLVVLHEAGHMDLRAICAITLVLYAIQLPVYILSFLSRRKKKPHIELMEYAI